MKKLGGMLLILWSCCLHADTGSRKVFITYDKNNNIVYSDTPSPGAKEINVRDSTNRMLSTETDNSKVTGMVTDTNANAIPVSLDANAKFEVVLTRPEEQGTVRENSGTVYVSGQIKPLFAQGLQVQIYLDGKLAAGPSSNANFILHDVERGEHKVMMELITKTGKVIAQSQTVTFYLHRATLNSPK
jgi:hypothetical protein